jgi:hypothetical protein
MAKDLTSTIVSNKSRRYGTEPINLLEIEFGGVTGTKYYSDRAITIDGNVYEAVVKDWGDIDFIRNRSATVQDLHIVLVNTLSSPISNIFLVDNPESKVAKLYQWYVDDAMEVGDKTLLFNGRITSPIKYGVDTVEFDIVNRIIDLTTKVGRVVTQSDFPRSLPSDRGKIIPKVIGSVENVPAVCVFTAGKSALRESLNESASTIEVDNGSVFPIDAAWVLVIEDEQILMEPNASGGNILAATTRGYNGTTATLHTKGTQMYEQLSTFRYQVFDDEGGVKAADIFGVRVNGVLLNDADYTIDQGTYPGQIVFDSYPQIDQEKETDFDDYTFDVVVNDGATPFADEPESLIDDNSSNYAWLKSGQRVTLQRAASLDNNNQFKRAFLSVTYFTDKQEWEGEIQASVLWDNNNLGILADPTFDPLIEEEEELESANPNQIVNPYNPVDPIQYGGEGDMIQGPEAEIVSETYSEIIDPGNLVIETKEFNPDAYDFQGGIAPGNRVPAEYFSAHVDGLIGKVTLFQHPCVESFPGTWEGDAFNFRWIDWVYSGFSFSPPTSGGTARITGVTVGFKDEFDPFAAGSSVNQYRAKKKGELDTQVINASRSGLKMFPLYVHDVDSFYVVIRTLTSIRSRDSFSVHEAQPVVVELWGKINDVYMKVEYEIVKEAPVPFPAPVIVTPPVVIPKPVRKSHEVTKTFEITDYVGSWGDLLNKSAEVIFESDGANPDTNLFIKDMHVLTESGKYTFEYTDEITADVDGYYVDGTQIETDYGSDGELITRPDQVFKFMLTWNSLFSLSDLDLALYDVAAAFYTAQHYRFDFAIVEETTLRDILEKMAFQVRTDQYWEAGEHKIKVMEVTSAVSKQITSSDIETLSIERSEIEELVNLLEIRYSIDYSFLIAYTPNKFRDIITIENPGSQSEYGSRKSRDETFYLDYIRDDTTASHIANYYLSFYSVIRRYITMMCFLNQLELEKHDIIGVTFPLDNLANTPGRILSHKLHMGGGNELDQIELLVLMEDYTYHKLEVSDGISFSDAIQLAVVPLVALTDGVQFSDILNFGFDVNVSDSIIFSEALSYSIHKTLFIRDGYSGGWGDQPWGESAWGGDGVSFNIADELSVEKIAALGTGFISASDTISISDHLLLRLVHRLYVADNDEFNLRIIISDNLTIVKV